MRVRCCQILGLCISVLFLFTDLDAQSTLSFSPLNHYLAFLPTDLPASQSINPAWLKTQLKEQVIYQVNAFSESGDFKRPFDPGRGLVSIYRASGTRQFGHNHLFTGTFAYHQRALAEKQWVHNSIPYNGNPFLFADSTVGGFNLRGLFWEVGYANVLRHHWTTGLAVFYNVDEEYKTVFPRSQVKHRDLQVRLGTGWQNGLRTYYGFCLSYFDFQENMNTTPYSLEQGKTPIFIKIRATDNPLLARGQTSEERLLAIQGVNLTLDGNQELRRGNFNFLAGAEQAQAQNVDGGAYPVAQGRWYVNRYYFQTEIKRYLWRNNAIGLFSNGSLEEQWAKHPEINQKIYALRTRALTGGVKIQLNLGQHCQTQPQIYFTSTTYKKADFYNGTLLYYPVNWAGYSQNFTLRNAHGSLIELTGGFQLSRSGNAQIYFERQDWYYQQITAREIDYYLQDQSIAWGELHCRLKGRGNSFFHGSLQYRLTQPATGGSPIFHKREQFVFNFSIER